MESQPIDPVFEYTRPFVDAHVWLKVLGAASILSGLLGATQSPVTVLIAWLPLVGGAHIIQSTSMARDASRSNRPELLKASFERLRRGAMMIGIYALLVAAGAVLFVGMIILDR